MKKLTVFAFLFVFVLAHASFAPYLTKEEKQEMIKKDRLSKREKLEELRLEKLRLQKELLQQKIEQNNKGKEENTLEEKTTYVPSPAPEPPIVINIVKPINPESMREPDKTRKPYVSDFKAKKYYPPLEMGLSGGLLAGIPGGYLEFRWNGPLSMEQLSIKTGAAYAQGKDTDGVDRKHALLFADGILHALPLGSEGVDAYLGGGLNYLVKTSGQVSGAVAGEIYVGLDSRLDRGGSIYAELGWGAIRTGFSPTYKGLNVTLGIKGKI
jgi:hypothetical protein